MSCNVVVAAGVVSVKAIGKFVCLFAAERIPSEAEFWCKVKKRYVVEGASVVLVRRRLDEYGLVWTES